jgi:SAM-dependent methyltransferase
MEPFTDSRIIESWHRNASPWTDAVREGRIESRVLVTNRAIVDAVCDRSPSSVLDIGCGEGWLARALVAEARAKGRQLRVIGVDVVPELVDQATRAGDGEFRVASYEAIAAGALQLRVDVAVANFSLIGRESVDGLVQSVPRLLNPRGALVVQTLHPVVTSGDLLYEDGWRPGSWAGCGSSFSDPAPWYFRTLESWVKLFVESGFRLVEMREPVHPASGKPASVLFVAEPTG